MRQSLRDFVTLHLIVVDRCKSPLQSPYSSTCRLATSQKICVAYEGPWNCGQLFATRLLREQRQEQNKDLYTTIVDLTKARYTVSCEDLWRIIATCGCLDKFMSMARKFHDAMFARVLD